MELDLCAPMAVQEYTKDVKTIGAWYQQYVAVENAGGLNDMRNYEQKAIFCKFVHLKWKNEYQGQMKVRCIVLVLARTLPPCVLPTDV